jgi:ribosomal protein S18 acetylase RimI-like enzyme
MTTNFEIIEINSVEADVLEELSDLLIDVVEDGASIGFLPPLSKEEATAYWKDVMSPGVILWIIKVDHSISGTVQLQLAQKSNATHRAEVAKLMVHPSKRKKGLARRLMENLENRAILEGRSLLVLDTRAGDPSNLLYKSLGYMEAGGIPNYAQSADGRLDGTIFYYKMI